MKILIVLLIAIFSLPVFAQANLPVNQLPTIQVTGTAEIQVVPDTATLSFTVAKNSKSVAEAKKQNDDVIIKVSNLEKNFGIGTTYIKHDYIRVKEVTKRIKIKDSDDYEEVFDGYRVSRNLIVKLRDITKFEAFLTALLEAGIDDVESVSFSSSELRKYKDQARAQAIKAAREKADALAKAVGQTIGKAVSIEEKNIDGYRSPSANISQNSFTISDEGNVEDVAVGTISVKAQIDVSFLLN